MLANNLCSGTGNFPDQIRVSANTKTKLIKCKDLTWIARSEMKIMVAKLRTQNRFASSSEVSGSCSENIAKAQIHFC